MARLRRSTDEGLGEPIELDRDYMIVGRAEDCDISVEKYHDVSREHCGIRRYKDGVHTIIDFGSRNGTFINDEQIFEEAKLAHGDRIRVCKRLEFVFQDRDGDENETPVESEIHVDGDVEVSKAMSEMDEALQHKGFKTVLGEIVKHTKRGRRKPHDPPTD